MTTILNRCSESLSCRYISQFNFLAIVFNRRGLSHFYSRIADFWVNNTLDKYTTINMLDQ